MAGLLQQRKEAAGWWNRLSSAGQGYRPLQAEARSPNVDQPDSLSPYPPSSPNPSDEPGRFAHITSRRYLRLIPPITLLFILFIIAGPAVEWLHDPSVISSFQHHFHDPPPTRVGPRKTFDLYHGKGCNISQLIATVKAARIRPDGRSRFEYADSAPKGLGADRFDLDGFEWSYDLEGCPPPHLFTPAETCDLLASFGGIRFVGDSLMRQFAQGVFLLLTNNFRGLVRDQYKKCVGNGVFTNGRYCKAHELFDTREMQHVCAEQPFVQYDQVWRWIHEDGDPGPIPADYNISHPLLDSYNSFVASLPPRRRQYSPVLIHSTGIHYKFDLEPSIDAHILPFLRNVSSNIPQPLKIWSGNPAPAPNKPVAWLETQGPAPTMRYNDEMNGVLAELSPGELSMGAWKQVEWYNTTDGALSYDGTHYSYQVAMERAQIFLNLLDLIWGEIVAAGGLVEGEPVAQPQGSIEVDEQML